MARKTGSRTRTGKANPDETGIGADSVPVEVTPVEEVTQPPLVAEATPVGGDGADHGVPGEGMPVETNTRETVRSEAVPDETMPVESLPVEALSGGAMAEETPVDEPAAYDPASAAVELPEHETQDTGPSSDLGGPDPDAPQPAAPDKDLIAPGVLPGTDPAPDSVPGAGIDPVVDTDRDSDTAALASATPDSADAPAPETGPVLTPAMAEPTGGPPPPAPARSALPLVLGGIFAAVLGALVVLFLLPQGWQGGSDTAMADRIAALEGREPVVTNTLPDNAVTADQLEALNSRLAALEAALTEQPDAPQTDLTPLEDRLTALESRLAEPEADAVSPDQLNAAVGAMTTRLNALEDSLAARIDGAVEAAMQDARAEIDTRTEGLDTREEDVAAAQALIARRTALASLIAAAESGEAAPEALADLPESPAALTPLGNGIATLPGLQQQFPAAARDALRADPVPPDAPMWIRLTEFTRSQTGARSLAPREGNDTDAVLSRAEAAMQAGDLRAAVTELDALTGEPAAAMAEWRAAAEERLAALAALRDVQAQLDDGE